MGSVVINLWSQRQSGTLNERVGINYWITWKFIIIIHWISAKRFFSNQKILGQGKVDRVRI